MKKKKVFRFLIFIIFSLIFFDCASLYKKWRDEYPISGFSAQITSSKNKEELKNACEIWLSSHTQNGGIWQGNSVIVNARKQFLTNGKNWTISSNLLFEMQIDFFDGKILLKTKNERVIPYQKNGKLCLPGEMKNDSGFLDEHAELIRIDASSSYKEMCDWFYTQATENFN